MSEYKKTDDLIIVVEEGKLIYLNKAAKSWFNLLGDYTNYSVTKILTPNPSENFTEENLVDFIKSVYKNRETVFFPWKIIHQNSTIYSCEIQMHILDIGNQSFLHITIKNPYPVNSTSFNTHQETENLKTFLDEIPIGIFQTDYEGNISLVNKKMLEILDYTGDNASGIYKLHAQDFYFNKEFRKAFLDDLTATGRIEKESFINTFTGQKKKVKGRAFLSERLCKNSDQKIITTLLEEITFDGHKERIAKSNESLLKSILGSIPTELWAIDHKGYVVFQSDFSKRRWGNLEGIDSKDFYKSYDVEELPDYTSKIQKALKGEVVDFEYSVVVEEKKSFTRQIFGPFEDKDGETGYISLNFNITKLKSIQEELEKQQAILERHQNELEDLVRERTEEIVDLNQKLTLSNEELQSSNENLKIANEDLVAKSEELQGLLNQLEKTKDHLVRSEKLASIGTLTAGIAHEINNPVNFISSGIAGIQHSLDQFALIFKEIKEYVSTMHANDNETIHLKLEEQYNEFNELMEDSGAIMDSMIDGINRTTKIIKGIRVFSRLDADKPELADINELLESTLVILSNNFRYKIDVHKQYEDVGKIWCFPGKLSQVFLNLINNSAQAIEEKGIIDIKTFMDKNAENVMITIKDNGKGISKKNLNRIFDPFFTTKGVGEGTGLGLSIVHGIIEQHNGNVTVNSTTGKGTEFIIELPLKQRI